MKAFLLLLTLLCAAAAGHAQTAPKPEPARRATVNLRKGEAVSGEFVRADSKRVYMEVDGEEVAVPLDDVASIVFSAAGAESPAAKALKALNALAEEVGPRMKHRDYINRFLEVRAVVSDQIPHIPEGDLRETVADVLRAFEIAAEIWDAAADSQPTAETRKMTLDALNTTWKEARRRLQQAEGLLAKQP